MNEIERGRLAEEVENNPVYAEAYERIEQELIAAWRDAKDVESREHLHRMLRCLTKVRQVLQSAMASGQIERKKLEPSRSLTSRLGWPR